MSEPNPRDIEREWFQQELRTALNGLYDPAILHGSALADIFGIAQLRDPVSDLRRALTDGIESLRPSEGTPLGSKSWRVYQILRRRYTEQLVQRVVANDLGLSIRQIQREEKFAREMLADYLWKTHHMDQKRALLSQQHESRQLNVNGHPELQPPVFPKSKPGEILNDQGDLEGLTEDVPEQVVEVSDVIGQVLDTLKGVLKVSGVVTTLEEETGAVRISVRAQILRQALLNIVNVAVSKTAGGSIRISTAVENGQALICVEACPGSLEARAAGDEVDDSLEIASRLVELCRGKLAIQRCLNPMDDFSHSKGSGFSAIIELPALERMTVLVIEDHADTIQLYQRYLADSPYRLVSATNAREGLTLAETANPQLIILDVMMPESDGWTLLGQMRVHPRIQDVPILVCSIIPQSRLALSLGAAEFLHKPISRAELLDALDRQAGLRVKGSG